MLAHRARRRSHSEACGLQHSDQLGRVDLPARRAIAVDRRDGPRAGKTRRRITGTAKITHSEARGLQHKRPARTPSLRPSLAKEGCHGCHPSARSISELGRLDLPARRLLLSISARPPPPAGRPSASSPARRRSRAANRPCSTTNARPPSFRPSWQKKGVIGDPLPRRPFSELGRLDLPTRRLLLSIPTAARPEGCCCRFAARPLAAGKTRRLQLTAHGGGHTPRTLSGIRTKAPN